MTRYHQPSAHAIHLISHSRSPLAPSCHVTTLLFKLVCSTTALHQGTVPHHIVLHVILYLIVCHPLSYCPSSFISLSVILYLVARDPVSPRNSLSLCDFSFFPQLLISKLHFTANRKPPFRHTSHATPHDLNLIAPSLAQHPHPDLSKKNISLLLKHPQPTSHTPDRNQRTLFFQPTTNRRSNQAQLPPQWSRCHHPRCSRRAGWCSGAVLMRRDHLLGSM